MRQCRPIKGLRELADPVGIGDQVFCWTDSGQRTSKTTPPFRKCEPLPRADLYVSVSRVEAFNVRLSMPWPAVPRSCHPKPGIMDLYLKTNGILCADETRKRLPGFYSGFHHDWPDTEDRRPEIRNSASEHSWDRAAHRMYHLPQSSGGTWCPAEGGLRGCNAAAATFGSLDGTNGAQCRCKPIPCFCRRGPF